MEVAQTDATLKRFKNTSADLKDLSFEKLCQMTNDFHESQEISTSELGVIYKGVTTKGELIVVERLFDLIGLDDEHIKKEFHNLSLLKHPNLVRFLSYCYEVKPVSKNHSNGDAVHNQETNRAFCFEYLHSDSLQTYLSDEFHGLDWHTRYKIIKGTCQGLNYLYERFKDPIYHLDLNPQNILLDENMIPKLAYFGFAKIFGENYLANIWNRNFETLKYCPPEYIRQGTMSKESFDVFSLGAVIIVMLTGRADIIRISNRCSKEFVDLTVKNWRKRLQQTFSGSRLEMCCHQVNKCMEVAFRCVEEDRHKRPRMIDVVYALNEMDGIIDRMEDTRGTRMDDINIELENLERIVDGSDNPSNLKLPLLQHITNNFSNELRIGSGGCGVVYKGILRNNVIAVKRLESRHTINERMFHQEVRSLMMVKHPNIVRFLGYCSHTEGKAMEMKGKIIMAETRERLLCFDYMSNGSLDNHLTDELRGLEWHTRYGVIKGICEGLQHLHKENHIIHMDLKPANILLDDHMVPKIIDFGLATLDDKSQTLSKERLFTRGYCAPEYIHHGKMSPKLDIYSLGVIIMELVTGSKEKPNITNVLRKWKHRWNKSEEDTSLGYKQVTNCLALAGRCIHADPIERPDIWDIMRDLDRIDSSAVHDNNDTECTYDQICILEDMLRIEPLQVHLPFELNKSISFTIQLANDTSYNIAFRVLSNSLRPYVINPDKGIVKGQRKLIVTITLKAQKKVPLGNTCNCKDDFSVQSTRANENITQSEITADMFGEERVMVDNVTLMVVLAW